MTSSVVVFRIDLACTVSTERRCSMKSYMLGWGEKG